MQIRIEDPSARDALETAFTEAGCSTLVEGDTFKVVHTDWDEVRFFLRAWGLLHPDVSIEVLH